MPGAHIVAVRVLPGCVPGHKRWVRSGPGPVCSRQEGERDAHQTLANARLNKHR